MTRHRWGLAAFAAAAISQGDPIRTGIQGFAYDIRTALLPFLFIFNTELLLIDVGPLKAIFVFAIAVVAMMLFAAATQGYFLARNKIWETVLLLVVAFTLFRPGYWLDQVQPEFATQPGAALIQAADAAPPGSTLRVTIEGPDFNDPDKTINSVLITPITETGAGQTQLEALGIVTAQTDGVMAMEEPLFGTPNEKLGQVFDFYGDKPVVISQVQVPNDRLPKEVFYLPALLILGLVILLQRRRQTKPAF